MGNDKYIEQPICCDECIYCRYDNYGLIGCEKLGRRVGEGYTKRYCKNYISKKELKENLDKMNDEIKPFVENYVDGLNKAIKEIYGENK